MVQPGQQHRLRPFPFLRYFDDGKELVAQIHDKLKELPEDVGEDFSKAESFHRMHAAFERDITSLGKQVDEWESAGFTVRRHTQQPPRHSDDSHLQAGEPDAGFLFYF